MDASGILRRGTANWEVNINHVVSFHCWRLGKSKWTRCSTILMYITLFVQAVNCEWCSASFSRAALHFLYISSVLVKTGLLTVLCESSFSSKRQGISYRG
jgi:hypothetical protein